MEKIEIGYQPMGKILGRTYKGVARELLLVKYFNNLKVSL